MNTNIEDISTNLQIAKDFYARYNVPLQSSTAFLYIHSDSVSLDFPKKDAALAGKVFGKTGWTRHFSIGKVNWRRTLLGVLIQIDAAEDIDLEGSPVPAQCFPILLEERTEEDV